MFAIPVFLVLIYYIHDLPKQKLMQRKMQFVAYEMAAILQNIAKQKGTNEKVTKIDIQNAMRLACLSIFPGTTQYGTGPARLQDQYLPLGYMPHFFVYCVKGTGENKAQVKWGVITFSFNPAISKSGEFGLEAIGSRKHASSSIDPSATEAHSIHPTLKISQNEIKIIVEAVLYYNSGRFFSDGKRTAEVPVGKAFNFLIFSPKPRGTDKTAYFTSVAIFTPTGTAFSETAPK